MSCLGTGKQKYRRIIHSKNQRPRPHPRGHGDRDAHYEVVDEGGRSYRSLRLNRHVIPLKKYIRMLKTE